MWEMNFNPYAFNAVSLVIIGMLSLIYLLRLKEKTAATWLITAGLAGLTVAMSTMFLTSVKLWGGALIPFVDATSVISMAAMIGYSYHYPQRIRSLESRLAFLLGTSTSLIAIGISTTYAYQILVNHQFESQVPAFFWLLNPVTFLAALLALMRRAFALQQQLDPNQDWQTTLSAIFHAPNQQVRLLRNFSLALSIGLMQGIATGLDITGLLSPLLVIYVINISLLLMVIAIIYASFELTRHQHGLIIQLVSLPLVTLFTILGSFGIFAVNTATQWADDRNVALTETIQHAIQTKTLSTIPAEVIYIAAWTVTDEMAASSDKLDAELIYTAQPDFDFVSLVEERKRKTAVSPPTWNYYIETFLHTKNRTMPVRLRFGQHPWASYHEYAGYTFIIDNLEYEVGFSLSEMSQNTHQISLGMTYAIITGTLFILLIFPRFFRNNLIQPLDRLLAGVRQADAGDLNISVPVTHEDEIGFLSTSFNKMAASLRAELSQRKRAEADLRQLASSLEQHVADRTRELEVLYDISSAASQAQNAHALLTESLEKTVWALRSTAGAIFLLDKSASNQNDAQSFQLEVAAQKGLPHHWQTQMSIALDQNEWLQAMVLQQEPILIPNLSAEPNIPIALQQMGAIALLMAPLQAEGRLLGLISIVREAKQSYGVDEIALLTSIAGQIGIAVHTEHLRQRAQQATVLEERQRLSRDLHDSVTQSLYGLVTLTEAGKIRAEQSDSKIVHTLTRISQTARQAIREMRLFIHQLRPPILEQEGLVNALDLRLAAVEGRSDLRAELLADEDICLELGVETAVYQIAQEALNNTLKHSQATAVTVTLRHRDENVLLEVSDNGTGFDKNTIDTGGQGLHNMQTRAAEIGSKFELITSPETGTTVRVVIKPNKQIGNHDPNSSTHPHSDR